MSDSPGYSSDAHVSQVRRRVSRGWFWGWITVGALGALGLVSLGPIALVPAAGAGAVMARLDDGRRSRLGLLAGAGLLALFVAYVQRDGPGTTCWHTASASGCDQHLNPLPWLIAGAVLTLTAFVGQAHRRG